MFARWDSISACSICCSRVPNLVGSGQVLMLAGASIAGTESAAEFLLSDEKMNAFLAKTPTGTIPYFELLF